MKRGVIVILTVDVGNTNIVLGGFENGKLKFTSRVATEASKMEDQYAIAFANIFKLYGYEASHFDGAIISTVVPPLISVLKSAIKKLLNCKVMVVGPGIKTGLNIKIDNPARITSYNVCYTKLLRLFLIKLKTLSQTNFKLGSVWNSAYLLGKNY